MTEYFTDRLYYLRDDSLVCLSKAHTTWYLERLTEDRPEWQARLMANSFRELFETIRPLDPVLLLQEEYGA